MRRLSAEQEQSQRAKIIAAARTIVINQGWDALTTRAIARSANISRTVVSDMFGASGLQKELVSDVFRTIRSVVESAGVIRLEELQNLILDQMLANPGSAILVARICRFIVVTENPEGEMSDILDEEREKTIVFINNLCSCAYAGAESLIDWYIAAAVIYCVSNTVKRDALKRIGIGMRNILC